MNSSEKLISSIFNDLTNVHENLLSLSEYILRSIKHNDTEISSDMTIYLKQNRNA